MSTRVEIEDLEATKSEKLLAVVMAAFLLMAGIWAYTKIDDYVQDAVDPPALSTSQRADITRVEQAQVAASRASGAERRAREELVFRREAYRTALDAGRPAAVLERRYDRAQANYAAARGARAEAFARVAAARPAANDAFAAERERFDDEQQREALVSFIGRFLLAALALGAAAAMLVRLRRRQSRWLALALAGVAAATVLSFVLAADYVTDYVDPLDLVRWCSRSSGRRSRSRRSGRCSGIWPASCPHAARGVPSAPSAATRCEVADLTARAAVVRS